MNRNRLIPLVGIAITIAILIFLFLASRPGEEDLEDGVVGVEVVDEDGELAAPVEDVIRDE